MNRGGMDKPIPEDWSDLQSIRDAATERAMEGLVVHEPPILVRCPDCHVPLVEGQDRVWLRHFNEATASYLLTHSLRIHRCTATTPIYPPVQKPLPDE